jgi:hypothetical protein
MMKKKQEERKRGRAEEWKKQKRREVGFLILVFSQLPRFFASALPIFSRVFAL